jgi:hypothetical protein
MLATEDDEAPAEEAVGEGEELELDLDLEVDEVPEEAESEDMDLEFDISGDDEETLILDTAEPEEAPADEEAPAEEADEETQVLDFEFGEEEEAPAPEEPVEDYEATVEIDAMPELREQLEEAKAKEAAAEKPKPVKEKRLSAPVLIAAVIVVLGVGGYIGFKALSSIGIDIQIPFISDLLKGEAQDVDKIEILQTTITSKFINNPKAGKLFIISGQVKNGHAGARNFIGIKGKLYKKGKVLATTVTAFGGNDLSDLDLQNMDLDSINKQLQNRAGQNKSNMNVKPGQTLPFMIVFSNLPDDLEEYELESGGSLPALK